LTNGLTEITDSEYADDFAGVPIDQSLIDSSSPWKSFSCSGYRINTDSGAALSPFAVGDVVTYAAGYDVWPNANNPTPSNASGVLSPLPTYTILDAAVMLTVSVAAVSSVSTTMF